eukprot:7437-Heterococcus_DN1.PRE.4
MHINWSVAHFCRYFALWDRRERHDARRVSASILLDPLNLLRLASRAGRTRVLQNAFRVLSTDDGIKGSKEAPATENCPQLLEQRRKDEAVRATIMQRLIETGEKERLKDMLREKLIQSGWRDNLKDECKDLISKKGLEKITVDELVAQITPKARATVPEEVKAELLKSIRKFLQST